MSCFASRRFKRSMGLAHSVAVGRTVECTGGPIRGREYRLSPADGRYDPSQTASLYSHQPAERIVDAWLGIPYAQPPVGERRFKKPVRVTPWREPRDCFQFGPRCPQTDEYFERFLNIVGKDEANCLTINVFAPRWTAPQFPSGLPVMVWVHGGGFVMHSSSNYGDMHLARNLCSKDVILVSFNYRLGAFGFLSTGDENCPGNYGLWDMTMALQWVQDNISRFGGDASNVTVFGQSAGGASVDLLTLSPHSRDLFHRVIPMAGTAECDFAIRTADGQREMTSKYVRFLGWKGDDDDMPGLVAWMRKQSAGHLELGISGKRAFGHQGQLIFVPVLDGDFFPRPLSELRKESPPKPALTGTTKNEGLFFMALATFPRSAVGMKKFLNNVVLDKDFDNAEAVRKELLDNYLKDIDPKNTQAILRQFVGLLGDYAISVGVWNYANKHAAQGNEVYLYSFDHCNHDNFGMLKFVLPYTGATHCTEVRYVLGKGVVCKFKPNADDVKLIHVMGDYFTNFAKFGTPDPSGEWKPFDPEKPFRHWKIDMQQGYADDYCDRRVDFWSKARTANKTRARL